MPRELAQLDATSVVSQDALHELGSAAVEDHAEQDGNDHDLQSLFEEEPAVDLDDRSGEQLGEERSEDHGGEGRAGGHDHRERYIGAGDERDEIGCGAAWAATDEDETDCVGGWEVEKFCDAPAEGGHGGELRDEAHEDRAWHAADAAEVVDAESEAHAEHHHTEDADGDGGVVEWQPCLGHPECVSDAEAHPKREEAGEVGEHRVLACLHEKARIAGRWQSKCAAGFCAYGWRGGRVWWPHERRDAGSWGATGGRIDGALGADHAPAGGKLRRAVEPQAGAAGSQGASADLAFDAESDARGE